MFLLWEKEDWESRWYFAEEQFNMLDSKPSPEPSKNLRKASLKGWLTVLFFSIAFLCPCSFGLVEMISGRFVMVEQPFFVQSLARENCCRFRMLMYFAATILLISTSFFIWHLWSGLMTLESSTMDAFSRSSCGVMETKETFQILVCFSRRMDLVSMMLFISPMSQSYIAINWLETVFKPINWSL